MLNLYTKAALCALKPDVPATALPDMQLLKRIQPDADMNAQYNNITEWKMGGIEHTLHPLFLQVLSLPMQLQMMVDKAFPFKPIGLVHLANEVKIYALPLVRQELQIISYFGQVFRHKRGTVFQVVTEAKHDQSLMLKASSYYLSRHTGDVIRDYSSFPSFTENRFMQTPARLRQRNQSDVITSFQFGHDLGRRYAKVSGDYNPIHLWPITANLFGFKQAIAHGMLTKALVVSALFNKRPTLLDRIKNGQHAELKAVFKAPIMLPNECELQMVSVEDDVSLKLCTKQRERDRAHIAVKFNFIDNAQAD